MARYVKPSDIRRAPRTIDWGKKFTGQWGMLGNDALGDCTCASLGHMDQVWSASTGHPEDITDEAIFGRMGGLYWRTGTEDTGRNMLDVLNEVSNNGLAGDKFAAFAAVDVKNHALIRYVTWAFGGVYLGITLPVTAQTQNVWDYVPNANGNEPGSWGGHAVNIVGYKAKGPIVVTWGALKQLTWAFVDHYCDEAYGIVSPDWLDALGKTPLGFNMAKLRADLAAIGG
jgi:hypothetical protein